MQKFSNFFVTLAFFGLSAGTNAQTPQPIAENYIGCEGQTITAGFVVAPNITYDWYTGETGGSPIYLNQYTVDFDINSIFPVSRTFWVQPIINGVATGARTPVTVTRGDNCGTTDPPSRYVAGARLFKEDFGGNDPTDPVIGPALPPEITTYTYFANENANGSWGYYTIAKVSPWWWGWWGQGSAPLYDHTYPDDPTRGYMFATDAAPDPGQFYQYVINNLPVGTRLAFSAWSVNLCYEYKPAKPNLIFVVEDAATGKNLARFHTGNIPDADPNWKNYGFTFYTISPDIILRIINGNVNGTDGNDFALDDIEIRLIEIVGCTDPAALNYNPMATIPSSDCIYPTTEPQTIYGCTDSRAVTYNPEATDYQENSCLYADDENTHLVPDDEIPETPVDTLGALAVENCEYTAANIISAKITKFIVSNIDESHNNHATNKPPHRHAYADWEVVKQLGNGTRDTIRETVQYCIDNSPGSIDNQPFLLYMSAVCKNPIYSEAPPQPSGTMRSGETMMSTSRSYNDGFEVTIHTFSAIAYAQEEIDVSALLAQIAELEADTALLNSQITSLQNDLDNANETISDLQNQLDNCEVERDNLQEWLDACLDGSGVPSVQSVSLQIYPNPVPPNGILYIENEALKTGDKIEIFDMNGKLISINFAEGAENSVNIGALPQGTYLLRLAGKQGVKFEVR